ncbi:glycoside hydrolase/phage tail family protein [Maritimibacter sp. DP1N21-5]|uniref:baseplate multidomain protein megatron n=1 Tax=Maritimibacter sp. DP1N21-5 TaxID=2836867 RepID=UPI001C45712C|nr:glycoside hydrolase TIM-barrel-like domain-containing protein [Maritimibacter sp. DP1N21-5]MBV7410161.1 glycoside hydrolase TIM-barrel-like domain-containing protein [Maritimibacter sp. DP1N21-5]
MATIVLSAAGAAIGSSIGGSLLGTSSVVIGRAVGAIIGRAIDNRLMGEGSEAVETGRVDRLRITGVSEGAAIPRIYGRFRVGGQVIWADKVREHRTISDQEEQGSGKGASQRSQSTLTEYSYSLTLAIALCEGEITHVGRIWADGEEIRADSIAMRVYRGDEEQLPDPAISARMGAGSAPAFRGTAYVVIENLDLTRWNNRVPVLNFEVFRPEQPDQRRDTARGTRAVALIPGTGEYALATQRVHFGGGPGKKTPVNQNAPLPGTDFAVSVAQMDEELPNLEAVSLVVSWFGTDLRAGSCKIVPRVDQKASDGLEMPWSVSGLTRSEAALVPKLDDKAVYGGTPSDNAVIQAIKRLRARGKAVTFYPFILMEQLADNSLPNPYSDDPGQPALPWRGRITSSIAPGRAGSPDGTAAASSEVAGFFGTAGRAQFVETPQGVSFSGPAQWSYRRFILHYAHLCKAAGGVDAFLIGSEMRGLTTIRGASGTFPAVAALRTLAADVKAILGPKTKVSYAADWSEYFGYHPQDGSGDVHFHLDPLWCDENIDFVGIDNYMPLSDWRDCPDHTDAHWGSIYNPDYLKANILGGEGYDWYYHAPGARAIQLRTPITDGAYGEDWVFRYKDIRSWWENPHFERQGGVKVATSTDWQPGMKPIWFTEMGCAAVDKATNEPNKFLDAKSSESALPRYSNGFRDDVIQMQYLRAMREFWEDPANNPTHPATQVQMVDMSRAHVWAWDARPFPWFPQNRKLWGDWENYAKGHWLNGRATSRSLASVVEEICLRSGLRDFDTKRLYGIVHGYAVNEVSDARAALQPLMLAYGFEAAERDGRIEFFSRYGDPDGEITPETLAVSGEVEGDLEFTRAPEAEMVGRVRLNYTEAFGDYQIRAAEARFADDPVVGVSSTDLPLVLTQVEASAMTERWLAQSRVSRDTARFAVPPSALGHRAGDVVSIDTPGGTEHFRLDRIEQAGVQIVQAVRVEPGIFEPSEGVDAEVAPTAFTPVIPVLPIWLDLPLLKGTEQPHRPHMAIAADPWPGPVAVFSSVSDDGYRLNTVFGAPARVGITESVLPYARPGVIDNGPALRVRLTQGAVSSSGEAAMLNGSNVAAIGLGGPDGWEVFQFAHAELIGENLYELRGRLRGQAGSDAFIPPQWEVGATVVFLDKSVKQLALARSERGLERHYRTGPASQSLDDESYVHEVQTIAGVGLRPYAPAHLSAVWSGSDLTLRWIRRTRIDGDSWEGVEVPLGEDAEQYLVKVFAGGALRREATVGTPGWTYTQPDRLADGVSTAFSVEVSQLSMSFGPGPGTRIDVA